MALLPIKSPGQDGRRILFREDFYSIDRWRPIHFPKIAAHTSYTIERKDGESVLKAASRSSASALVCRETFSVYEYPRARWRWRVDNVYGNLSPEAKSGDDYPLRVYVTFLYDPVKAGPGLMCRRQVSVGWEGTLYDCDFNLAFGLPLDRGAPDHIRYFTSAALKHRRIVTGDARYWLQPA